MLFVSGILYLICGGLGITAGAHRLWSHRSYKATWQLRMILGIFQASAFQVSCYAESNCQFFGYLTTLFQV